MLLREVKTFLGFDTETTGVNVKQDRILTASLIRKQGSVMSPLTTWINPGIPIPAGATAIHGITDEVIQRVGSDPKAALSVVRDAIYGAWENDTVLVAHNMSYDLSILSNDLQRHGEPAFKVQGPVLDTMVLFRMMGNKKASLDFATKKYGIVNTGAHSSEADTIATLELLAKIIENSERLANTSVRELYTEQRVSHRSWVAGMKSYYTSTGRDFDNSGIWPIEE